MSQFRRRQALLLAGLLFFLAFLLLTLAAVWVAPRELHLLPEEVGRLKVRFPLSLSVPEGARSFLLSPPARGPELVFRSAMVGAFQVELRLFDAFSVRRVAVTVVPERRVVPSGQAIGVLLAVDGVIVVGHRPVRALDGSYRYPAKETGIEVGDIILAADGTSVHDAEDLVHLIGAAVAEHRAMWVTFRRAGQTITRPIRPVECRWPPAGPDRGARGLLGLFVEEPAAGVGTLTFYDRTTGTFAALGHRINELGGQRHVWLEGGKIVAARISGVEQGQRGSPGEKIGTFSGPEDIIGTIESNSRFGLFGRLDGIPSDRDEIPVALAHQVHPGPARILTVVQGTRTEEFRVEILRVYPQSRPHDKGMVIRVTDPRLLALTGGIVQGMSGSPIVQGGRLVGAVTHVLVNDPTRGYGVLAEWMLQEMEAMAAARAA